MFLPASPASPRGTTTRVRPRSPGALTSVIGRPTPRRYRVISPCRAHSVEKPGLVDVYFDTRCPLSISLFFSLFITFASRTTMSLFSKLRTRSMQGCDSRRSSLEALEAKYLELTELNYYKKSPVRDFRRDHGDRTVAKHSGYDREMPKCDSTFRRTSLIPGAISRRG